MIAMLAWTIAIVAALPGLALVAELLAGLARDSGTPLTLPPPPIAVLVPAHDEAAGIARTIFRIRQQLRATDRVIVIADNCTDDTAARAAGAGAAVIERTDPARRGKAYALAYGREALRAAPPAVVLVVDADCPPAPQAIPMLAASVHAQDAVVQATYLLDCAAAAPPLVRISTFAFLVKNLIRQRGLQRLCGVALLQGSGMGFPWRLFADAPLASASLVEDMELGLTLALGGNAVRFEPRACFVSAASSSRATISQRTRWEHGAIGVAGRFVPRLVAAGFSGRPRLLLLATDLIIPPLALFVVAEASVAALLLFAATNGSVAGPAVLQSSVFALAMLVLGIVWVGFGRHLVPARALPGILAYVLWKLPIYAAYLLHRQRHWVRTDRAP
ncbi:glycosyltransferase family 2 protein [Hephaestia sp. GCM10023244]|uniref:glycosyltransferase family 2 protein n=1 Tax=unclassified Hephaestia TaxID=2631281 RepID=UPI002076E6BA|nr:glycosyltransferase family 2 protein [Hephaestia sp. MAHUQ-44]MCM8731663.1 glycosyltransferase family 2 protein [Hephaestia sp. MAHUQ-44]